MNRCYIALVLLLSSIVTIYADIAVTSDARTEVSVTVFQNCGYIRDTRKLTLPQGPMRIRFEGVAPRIVDQSIVAEWTPENQVELLEQNYEYDLISPQRLMEKFVGKEVELVVHSPGRADSIVQRAELVSVRGSEPVFRIGTMITYGNIGRILFPYVPEDLYTKPTIIWRVQSAKRQDVSLSACYIVDGMSWTADYVIELDQTAVSARFIARLCLENNSGYDFDQALFTFAPGTIRRAESISDSTAAHALPGGQYQILPARKNLSIRNGQTKQVAWIVPTKIKIKPRYVIDCPAIEPTTEPLMSAVSAYLTAEVENNEASGLGIPLPQGVIRIFHKSLSGESRLLGEDSLKTSNPHDVIHVKSSYDPDILLNRKTNIDRRKSEKGVEYSEELVISNSKSADVRVGVREKISRFTKVIKSSDPYSQGNDTSLEWNVVVKGRQSRTIKLVFSTSEP